MNSIREQLLRRIIERLSALEGMPRVLRMPVKPVTPGNAPELLLFVEEDNVTGHANTVVDRSLVIRLVALASGGDAFDLVDHLIVRAHAELTRDVTLEGLALGIREIDCEWEVDEAGETVVAIPARYEIRYRTRVNDLTQTGTFP